MIRLLYLGMLVYLAVSTWKLISSQIRARQVEDDTPPSQTVIDVEAKDADND